MDWGAVRRMLWQSSASCNGAFRRMGVVASAMRVLVVAFSAGSAVIGFAGTACCGRRAPSPDNRKLVM